MKRGWMVENWVDGVSLNLEIAQEKVKLVDWVWLIIIDWWRVILRLVLSLFKMIMNHRKSASIGEQEQDRDYNLIIKKKLYKLFYIS